jgi:penicillin-binding protein 1A
MNATNQGGNKRRTGQTSRKARNTYVTKSGQTIKIHRNLSERWAAARDARSRRRAQRLAGLPKSRVKRILYMMQPKRMYKYWFSREGGIMALKIMGISIFAGLLLLLGVFAYFRKDLPNLRDISGEKIGGSISYYDRTGQTLLFEDYDAVKRIPVQDDQISQYVKSATVAVEDKDFFKHGGFDVRGIARAGISDILHRGGTQGGSTITQQLVKLNNNWTKDRTITRKVKELILSVELERTYSKKEILAGYLNAAPYGNVQNGVEAASRDYFEKSAKDLTLDEAAFLAAIPKAPSVYSPYGPNFDPQALKARQNYILDVMEQEGMITKQQRDDAKKVDILAKYKTPKPKYEGIKAPYFVLTAKEQLETKYGDQTVKRGGWKVITTLDLNLQNEAERQVQKGIAQVKRQGGDEAAFAAEDVKTGQMVALVGGVDFNDPDHGQNNYARYRLPPGSSFKPYDYSALIDTSDNVGAGSVLYDSQAPIPGYPCTNKAQPKQGGNCLWDYDFRYPGALTIRYALGGSRNVPAVKAMEIVGVDKTIGVAKKMMTSPGDVPSALSSDGRGDYNCYVDEKFTQTGPCYASSAIGDGAYLKMDEHVHGLATISRNGNNIPQTYILKIEKSDGTLVDEWKPTKGEQTIRAESAYIVADMLSDPNASYFPAGRKPHRSTNSQGTWKFAMKTGTTNDAKDGWMVGFSTQYAAAVWVGYHNRTRAMTGTMEGMTQPIWQGWMDAAHKNLKPEDRPKPAGIQTLPAFVVRNNPGLGAVVPSTSTDLFPSWYKGSKSKTGVARTIDIVSNKSATDCTPTRARKDITDAAANSFSIDKFVTGSAASADTSQQDDVHLCTDVRPEITNISATKNGNSYHIVASVQQGTHPLSSDQFPGTLTFSIDGQILSGGSISVTGSGQYAFDYTPNFSGDKTLTATIVDSVLYDNIATVSITGSGSSGGSQTGGPLTLTDANRSGTSTSVTVKWSGGSGSYTVYRGDNNTAVPGCNGISGTQCAGTIPLSVTSVYVKDTSGNTSNTVVIH